VTSQSSNSARSAGISDAFLWNGSMMTDLTTTALSGLSSPSVAAINDNGQILAQDGGTALLLTPN
jgi:uncharacterized membrane protein